MNFDCQLKQQSTNIIQNAENSLYFDEIFWKVFGKKFDEMSPKKSCISRQKIGTIRTI